MKLKMLSALVLCLGVAALAALRVRFLGDDGSHCNVELEVTGGVGQKFIATWIADGMTNKSPCVVPTTFLYVIRSNLNYEVIRDDGSGDLLVQLTINGVRRTRAGLSSTNSTSKGIRGELTRWGWGIAESVSAGSF
jgi:hypothetical protein